MAGTLFDNAVFLIIFRSIIHPGCSLFIYTFPDRKALWRPGDQKPVVHGLYYWLFSALSSGHRPYSGVAGIS